MDKIPVGSDLIRKTKRKPLVCVPCRLRKVKCDKNIPCKNCVVRGLISECHREIVIVRGVVANAEKVPNHGGSAQRARNGIFNENQVDNIRACVERLTFGFIKVERLFKAESQKEVYWPEFHLEFETIMSRINHLSSYSLCSFACYYINFIHNGVIPTLFMREHEEFWNGHVEQEPACLLYHKPSKIQSKQPRDYYFWMALYYATICNGIYFGSIELKDDLNFSVQELQSLGPKFFRAAHDCLCRAHFMDSPDIRFIQVYCLMSTCFHAYGSVGLSQSLLAQCVDIARKLKMDIPDPTPESKFSSEVKKILWYTLCLID